MATKKHSSTAAPAISRDQLKIAFNTIARNAAIAADACEDTGTDSPDILLPLLLRIGVTSDHLLAMLGIAPALRNIQERSAA